MGRRRANERDRPCRTWVRTIYPPILRRCHRALSVSHLLVDVCADQLALRARQSTGRVQSTAGEHERKDGERQSGPQMGPDALSSVRPSIPSSGPRRRGAARRSGSHPQLPLPGWGSDHKTAKSNDRALRAFRERSPEPLIAPSPPGARRHGVGAGAGRLALPGAFDHCVDRGRRHPEDRGDIGDGHPPGNDVRDDPVARDRQVVDLSLCDAQSGASTRQAQTPPHRSVAGQTRPDRIAFV
jgi:hypothetical protein